jgi:NADH-quinone oxidoreductase subunit A
VEWTNFTVYTILTLVVGFSILGLSSLLGPKRPKPEKLDPYECGVPVLDSARERFSVHFYLVAIMFMLFDIESVFLIPWAVMYKSLGTAALVQMGIFVGVLGFGLLYIVRRGVLKWE